MGSVSAEELKAALGPQPAGPTGFDIHHEVKAGTELAPGSNTVQTEVNQASVSRAEAQNNSGENAKFKQMADATAKAGSFSATGKIQGQQDRANEQYLSMFAKVGVAPKIQDVMGRAQTGPAGPRPGLQAAIAKNPVLRKQQAQHRNVDAQIKAAAQQNKSAVIDPNQLPEASKMRMVEQSIQKGEHVTPLGSLASSAVQALAPEPVKAAMSMIKTASAWERWNNVGALIGGSYTPLTPRLKRT